MPKISKSNKELDDLRGQIFIQYTKQLNNNGYVEPKKLRNNVLAIEEKQYSLLTYFTEHNSKYKNKSIAFKFNLKKGWKLRGGISYARSNWGVAKMLPNGSKIKVAGGSGFLAVALAENIKTGQRERIHIYFK